MQAAVRHKPLRVSPGGGQERCTPSRLAVIANYKITVKHEGKIHELEVKQDEYILEAALDKGINLPHGE